MTLARGCFEQPRVSSRKLTTEAYISCSQPTVVYSTSRHQERDNISVFIIAIHHVEANTGTLPQQKGFLQKMVESIKVHYPQHVTLFLTWSSSCSAWPPIERDLCT